jgi:very-short-patch-repair endonuclease
MNEPKRRWRTTAAMQERAQQLRRRMTGLERKLWQRLRRKQVNGLRFRRQHPIDRFIVDFYCPEHRLVIEIDGAVHTTQVEYDEVRTEWLEARGYRVLRFTNQEVRHRLDNVLEAIRVACESGE